MSETNQSFFYSVKTPPTEDVFSAAPAAPEAPQEPATPAPQFVAVSSDEYRRRQVAGSVTSQSIGQRRGAKWLNVSRKTAEGMVQGQRRAAIDAILKNVQKGELDFEELDKACVVLEELFRAATLDSVGVLHKTEQFRSLPATDSFDPQGLLKMAAETLNVRVLRIVANALGRWHNEGGSHAMDALLWILRYSEQQGDARHQKAYACLQMLVEELKYPVRRETRELAHQIPAAKGLFKDSTL